MTELEIKQRKRRFWVWITLTILFGVSCFYAGYAIGKSSIQQSDNCGLFAIQSLYSTERYSKVCSISFFASSISALSSILNMSW